MKSKRADGAYRNAWLEMALSGGRASAWYFKLESGHLVFSEALNLESVVGNFQPLAHTREDWVRRIHPEDRAMIIGKVQSLIDGTLADYEVEYRTILDTGKVRWICSRARAISGPNGNIIGVAGVSSDITEGKNLRRTRELVMATLSHDLRNSLAAARAHMGLAAKFPDRNIEHANSLRKADTAIERADRLIQNLLDVSRANEGKPIQLAREHCDLRAYLADAIADLSLQYGNCRIS